ncbi:MAG: hypothetical protein ACLVB5_11335 [Christensenellales bacterium]
MVMDYLMLGSPASSSILHRIGDELIHSLLHILPMRHAVVLVDLLNLEDDFAGIIGQP